MPAEMLAVFGSSTITLCPTNVASFNSYHGCFGSF